MVTRCDSSIYFKYLLYDGVIVIPAGHIDGTGEEQQISDIQTKANKSLSYKKLLYSSS